MFLLPDVDEDKDQALDLVNRDLVLLGDRMHDLQKILDTLAEDAPDYSVRAYAEGGARALELIVSDTKVLFGGMLTALDIVKRQRDDALEEIDFGAEEAYEAGYEAAMGEIYGDTGEDDELTASYNEGAYDQLKATESQLGMTVEEARQHIQEADQALAEWEAWANGVEAA